MDHHELDEDLTVWIRRAIDGDREAEEVVCEAVYRQLHAAARYLIRSPGDSVQPTMLVHDVLIRLFRKSGLKHAPSRRYFFAVAGDQMRKLLVDHHRRRSALKAGGGWRRTPLEIALDNVLDDFQARNHCDIETLECALAVLKGANERQYHVVVHRFFDGMTIRDIADCLGIGVSSVERDWRIARAKLHQYLSRSFPGERKADHDQQLKPPAH